MFEFLFKYPPALFSKGHIVFLTPWPVWLMALLVALAAGFLFWHVRQHRGLLTRARSIFIWMLETALVTLLLFMLWHPAISVATLRPQQNIIAVLMDDSRSMGTSEGGKTRLARAQDLFTSKLAPQLASRFQTRLYRFGSDIARVETPNPAFPAAGNATRIGEALNNVVAESSALPLGAVVLLTDGGDTSGGIDLATIARLRQQRIPVHTIGFGREKFAHDLAIEEVIVPQRALADSRVSAQVTLRQNGYTGQRARVSVRDGAKVLASETVEVKPDGATQSTTVVFSAGPAGPRTVQVTLDPLPGEENTSNNSLTRLINVTSRKPRILYVEGEPRWEYKFIRRAVEDDRTLEVVTMLRTTPNKIYRQGIGTPTELEQGFPATADELFSYDGLIIGSVEASYFTPTQQDLIREFANRRGGGVLFLGGRFGLADGGYSHSLISEMLPVKLPAGEGTFHREYSVAELTLAGRESILCRLEEGRDRNAERWKKLPMIANYQVIGDPKPGAVTLADVAPAGQKKTPLLVIENYGRGRTAVLATAGTWRWKMQQEHTDRTHTIFWQQVLRWLVSETPGQVVASTPRQVLSDETSMHLRVEARDKSFQPLGNAHVEAHLVGPDNLSETITLAPQPLETGVYAVDWSAAKPGSYLAEITVSADAKEIGRDVLTFRREDGVSENFHINQDRALLEKLSEQTGGRYYTPSGASRLPEEISYSEAGLTTHATLDLWDMPIVFLLVLALRGGEWLLRRKWGVV